MTQKFGALADVVILRRAIVSNGLAGEFRRCTAPAQTTPPNGWPIAAPQKAPLRPARAQGSQLVATRQRQAAGADARDHRGYELQAIAGSTPTELDFGACANR